MAKLPRDDSLERAFLLAWQQVRPDRPPDKRNYVFLKGRKFELDFAWLEEKVGVEIQGGTGWAPKGTNWRQRHVSPGGYRSDREKMRLAILNGWVVLEYTKPDLTEKPIQCAEEVSRVLESRR